ncbi:universal stress protein [Lysobacter soli]|uniref:universal stress protein n=1 Tax=Lysobacter soli TaxID=453783 RepID=UPI00240FECC7|nr:universal stress protein [Lysobacter soli]MDG2518374.1 universal stress protein [Lysobacter soli]
MRIALAVDGSKSSSAAARHVLALQRALSSNDPVVLIYVDEPLLQAVAIKLGVAGTQRYHEENATHALRNVRAAFKRAGVEYRERMLFGDPAAMIGEIVKKERCDLVVMGSHGRGAMKSLFLGSVTMKVIAQSKVPVTVVRGRVTD